MVWERLTRECRTLGRTAQTWSRPEGLGLVVWTISIVDPGTIGDSADRVLSYACVLFQPKHDIEDLLGGYRITGARNDQCNGNRMAQASRSGRVS
jgi:hypothetical protein